MHQRELSQRTRRALATLMIYDPEDFVAVFFLDNGGVLAETLQLGGPDT
jgi:hypothetical protein